MNAINNMENSDHHYLLLLILLLTRTAYTGGDVSVDISVYPVGGVSIFVTPSEQPIVRGVGETLTLTCTALPAATLARFGNSSSARALVASLQGPSSQNASPSAGGAATDVHDLFATEHEYAENQAAPVLHWIMPINAPERVREERLGSGSVAGLASVRVLVQRLRETDSGNYTCELPAHHISAVAELHVMHRDVVQQCGLTSFQCSTGECIPLRFVCDAKPDCPEGTDELPKHCGTDVCKGKLQCNNGRCLDPVRCCRPPHPPHSPPPPGSGPAQPPPLPHPANCSINPAIRCCRKLMHPAALDQDLYYLATRPRPHQAHRPPLHPPPSPLLIGSLVAVANIATVCLVLVLRQRFWQPSNGPAPHQHYAASRASRSWWRPAHSGDPSIPHAPPRPLVGLFSRSRHRPLYPGYRPAPQHSGAGDGDFITLATLGGPGSLAYTLRGPSGGVDRVRGIPAPQFCRIAPSSTPPPSYQAVCGPPPPYSSEDSHQQQPQSLDLSSLSAALQPAPPPSSTAGLSSRSILYPADLLLLPPASSGRPALASSASGSSTAAAARPRLLRRVQTVVSDGATRRVDGSLNRSCDHGDDAVSRTRHIPPVGINNNNRNSTVSVVATVSAGQQQAKLPAHSSSSSNTADGGTKWWALDRNYQALVAERQRQRKQAPGWLPISEVDLPDSRSNANNNAVPPPLKVPVSAGSNRHSCGRSRAHKSSSGSHSNSQASNSSNVDGDINIVTDNSCTDSRSRSKAAQPNTAVSASEFSALLDEGNNVETRSKTSSYSAGGTAAVGNTSVDGSEGNGGTSSTVPGATGAAKEAITSLRSRDATAQNSAPLTATVHNSFRRSSREPRHSPPSAALPPSSSSSTLPPSSSSTALLPLPRPLSQASSSSSSSCLAPSSDSLSSFSSSSSSGCS